MTLPSLHGTPRTSRLLLLLLLLLVVVVVVAAAAAVVVVVVVAAGVVVVVVVVVVVALVVFKESNMLAICNNTVKQILVTQSDELGKIGRSRNVRVDCNKTRLVQGDRRN